MISAAIEDAPNDAVPPTAMFGKHVLDVVQWNHMRAPVCLHQPAAQDVARETHQTWLVQVQPQAQFGATTDLKPRDFVLLLCALTPASTHLFPLSSSNKNRVLPPSPAGLGTMSDSEDPAIDPLDEGGDDLFGDEGDEDVAPTKERVLDDDDLASDPEGDGYAQYARNDDDDQQFQTRDRVVMGVKTYRHRVPKPKDGALRVLRVPKFIKIMPEEYEPETFQPTEFDVTNAKSQHPKHVARVRRDHSTDELKSNTNIFRWSDGSVTMAIGGEHYEVQKKALAPAADKPYNELHDGHYYAATAELSSNILMTVGHITEQYNVRPNKDVGDDALALLAERMQQASKPAQGGDMFIRTTRDPELQKKNAEMAEKERMKAQRRRENAAAKMDGGYGRSSGRGALSIGDLEGGRRGAGGSSRKRGAPGAGKPKRRRGDESSDEDLVDAVGRHEGYNLDDGFVVDSDEDDMESEPEEEEEELLDDEDEKPRSKKRQRTRDRSDGEDAEGSDVGAGRARRRNVIDDDEE
ncbi:hypothetical protein FZEAL_9529 [Fusarium zealandicum]|uniref:RNA polymerase-associated protein LEO1 n=1 Tax=Fusarium zealandicum TaxID=1053134 RepID=A0A8H4UAG5_9HYPO|nr:hypothetical protein FZEAL_9529 [Fusarium zealandicum]